MTQKEEEELRKKFSDFYWKQDFYLSTDDQDLIFNFFLSEIKEREDHHTKKVALIVNESRGRYSSLMTDYLNLKVEIQSLQEEQ